MASPTDISGIAQRFRASQLTGYTNGAGVSSAPFETGSVTMTQATPANQPVFVSSSINGNAGLRFNGSSTFISGTLSSQLTQPFSLTIVAKIGVATGRQILIDGSGGFVLLNDASASSYNYYAGASVYGGTPTASPHAITIVSTVAATTIYVDGTQVASGNSGAGTISRYLLGAQSNATSFFTGDICEIVAYSKALSTAELSTLDTYVQSTYAISMADAAATNMTVSRLVRSSDLTSLILANSSGGSSGGSMQANVQTASYTTVLSDAGKVIEMNVANPNTVTIPPNSSVAYAVGTVVEVCQVGAGQTNIVAGTGVIFDAPKGSATYSRYSTVRLRQRAINEWVVSGNTTIFYDVTSIGSIAYRMRASTLGITTDGTSVASAPFEIGGVTLTSTGTGQPTWRAQGLNGKPYISFNGSTNYLSLSSGAPALSQPLTVCVALQVNDYVSSQEVFKAGGIELLLNQSAGTWSTYSGSLINGAYAPSGVQSLTGVFGAGGSQGSIQAYTNGGLAAFGGGGGNDTSGGDLYVGTHPSTPRYLRADLYEIIVFNKAMTTSDLQLLHNYVRATYF